MKRREFFRYIRDAAEVAAGTAAVAPAVLALLSETGCGESKDKTEEHPDIATTREVPVLRHVVTRNNESILGLLKSEFRRGGAFGRIEGYTGEDEFVMMGDTRRTTYRFNVLRDALNKANPGLDAGMDTRLRLGQTLNFPDFNVDGHIGEYAGEKCGVLILTGVRNYRGKLVSKDASYRPLK